MVKKLVNYEDLEEQGRLVKLPCKDVYFIVDINNPKYAMVMKRPIRELAIYEIESIDKENCKYFSTKEKAESKLKELVSLICTLCIVLCSIPSSIRLDMAVGSNFHFTFDY